MRGHRFPPHALRDYSLIADGYRGALCGPHGEMVWMCAPRWHDDAVFAGLLGGGGFYSIHPGQPYVWGGSYEPRSLIWRSRWVTTHTIVECREALAYPGHPDKLVLLRRIEAPEQEITMLVELDTRAGFGTSPMREIARDERGDWTARTGSLWLRWSGAGNAVVDDTGALRTDITVPAGAHHDLVLELAPRPLREPPVEARWAWRSTETAWRTAVPDLAETAAPRDAQHAYAVLRGVTAPGGGMAAAVTTSLPERAEQGRNYDYRYSWVRDQSYAGIASAAHGRYPLLDDAVSFLTARVLDDGDRLAPAYTADGDRIPDEQRIAVPGYPGGQTVVTGNRAARQSQLDCYGELLQLLATAARHDRLDSNGWRAIHVAARAIGGHWTSPDAGLWELHDDWWTHSRLTCVAGLRAAAEVSRSSADADSFTALADTIAAETTRRCLHPHGYWQRAPGLPEPDAALVLPPVRGALPANDPRTHATLDAVRRDLSDDGYVYRYSQHPRRLGDDEGAFLLCGFFMALAEHQQGNFVDAFRWFERNRASCGPPGLYSEEYDVEQRQLRGNLPQAFVHALLLECSARLRDTNY